MPSWEKVERACLVGNEERVGTNKFDCLPRASTGSTGSSWGFCTQRKGG